MHGLPGNTEESDNEAGSVSSDKDAANPMLPTLESLEPNEVSNG